MITAKHPSAGICSAAYQPGLLQIVLRRKALACCGQKSGFFDVSENRKCAQVQVVALECLPRIPARKLRRALAGEELGKRTLLCLANSSKEVRWVLPMA